MCIVKADMLKRPLWIILCVALVLRAGLLAGGWRQTGRFFRPDSAGYDALARSLAERGEFSRTPDGPAELFRTPGYPIFLAYVYSLSGNSVHAALAVQILLDVGLCGLVYLLGARLFDRRVGLWAAGLQAVSTVAIASSVQILSDSLFAFLLTAAILLLVHYFKNAAWPSRPCSCTQESRAGRPCYRSLLLSGIVVGSACYVRPVGLFFGVMVIGVLLLRCRSVRSAGAFAAVLALCVVPWIVRNHYAADYRGFSTVPAEAAFKFQGPYVMSRVEGISVESARRRLEAELDEYKSAENPTPGQLESRRASLGLRVLLRHPWAFLSMQARGSLTVWAPGEVELPSLLGIETGGRGTAEVLASKGLPAAVRHYLGGQMWILWALTPFILVLLLRYGLAAIGVIRHARLRMGPAGWLVVITVLLFALLPGVFGHPRFRVPITPLLNVAAGAGMVWIIGRIRRQRRPIDRSARV
ncbi:MAG: glycosyltransferase family 39 protein [Planctomycetota bacterium]|nr:glycosyltransferase family 39 protein [Planctomycetota bacterium]